MVQSLHGKEREGKERRGRGGKGGRGEGRAKQEEERKGEGTGWEERKGKVEKRAGLKRIGGNVRRGEEWEEKRGCGIEGGKESRQANN